MKIQMKLFSFMNPFLNQLFNELWIWSFQVREIVEEICIVIVQKLIYEVDKNRPSFQAEEILLWWPFEVTHLKIPGAYLVGNFWGMFVCGSENFWPQLWSFQSLENKVNEMTKRLYKNQEKVCLKLKGCPLF